MTMTSFFFQHRLFNVSFFLESPPTLLFRLHDLGHVGWLVGAEALAQTAQL